MSDDPIQAIVDKLDAIEGSVSKLVAKIDTVEKAAERGASRAAAQIADNVNSIHKVACNLERAIVPLQAAVRAVLYLPRMKVAALVLGGLLALFVAFTSGVLVTRSGLLLSTKVGCLYLGGTWSMRADTNNFVCWR